MADENDEFPALVARELFGKPSQLRTMIGHELGEGHTITKGRIVGILGGDALIDGKAKILRISQGG